MKRTASRHGLSLLEVLISVFILLFGLLAVAALIPVAGLRIIQTRQADYSSACGRAGANEVRVRGMLEPRRWLRHGGSLTQTIKGFTPMAIPETPPPPSANLDQDLGIPFEDSYAIDPLGFANQNAAGRTAMRTFPHAGPTTMRRLTLDTISATNDPFAAAPPPPTTYRDMPLELADRIFTWHDDLSIPVPDVVTERPEPIMRQDASNNNLMMQIEGEYSWLVTVTPQAATFDFTMGSTQMHYVDRRRTYLVSVVVFYNRDFSQPDDPLDPTIPPERSVKAEFLGGGYGGGDVRLFLDPSKATPDLPTYLDVREGHWLMLCGEDQDPDGNGIDFDSSQAPNAVTNVPPRKVFRWYRVVGTGAEAEPPQAPSTSTALWQRYVTLAGPDWNTDDPASGNYGWCFADTDNSDDVASGVYYPEVDAALFTRVIGVYTSTVDVQERGSIWGN